MRRRQLLAGLGAASAAPAASALSTADIFNLLFSDGPAKNVYPWHFFGQMNVPAYGGSVYVETSYSCPPFFWRPGPGVAYLFNSHLEEADIPIELEKDLRLVGMDSGQELLLRRADEYCVAPTGYPATYGYRFWRDIAGFPIGTHANWGGWTNRSNNRQLIELFVPGVEHPYRWAQGESVELTFV